MASIVLPYVSPDLDGVACAIAIAGWKGAPWAACAIGNFDEETRVVLACLGLNLPQLPPDWVNVERIWLVDTHHPFQLPASLPYARIRKLGRFST